MQLDLEIAYWARGRTKRSDHPKNLSLKENVSLQISEVADHDAPIAVTWEDCDGPGHTRWYGGRHYSPYKGPHSPETLLRTLTMTPCDIEDITVGYFEFPTRASLLAGDASIVEIDEGARRSALQSAKEWEDDCLIVDGRIYMACATPQYAVNYVNVKVSTKHVRQGHRAVSNKRPHEAGTVNWFYGDRHDLTEPDGVTATLGAIYGYRAFSVPDVQISIPESLQTTNNYARLREAAVFLMDNLQYQKISDAHPAVLRGLATISEAMWGQNPLDGDPDLLAEALDTARRDIAAVDTDGRIYLPQIMWRVAEAVRRHFDSDISFDPVLSTGPRP